MLFFATKNHVVLDRLTIGKEAFNSCSKLSGEISLPECKGKLYVGTGAFCGDKAVTSIVFPKVELRYDENPAGQDPIADSSFSSLLIDDIAFRYMFSLDTIDLSQITFTNPTDILSVAMLKKAFFLANENTAEYARMFQPGIRTISKISGAGYGDAF
ncbi:MAG: hypothetical protein MJ223_02330 [Mycoplasmoidaceae bacterium]|nr:hypothetical protein [Mycoplasmoidaceae bacterium]